MMHEPGTIRSDWIEPFAKLSNTLACRTSASVMFGDTKALAPILEPWPREGRAGRRLPAPYYGVAEDRRRRVQPDRVPERRPSPI